MNNFRRTQGRNFFDPDNNRGRFENVNVDSLNIGRVNVDRVARNGDPAAAAAAAGAALDADRRGGGDPDGRRSRRERDGDEIVLNIATGGAGPLAIITTVLTAPIPIVTLTLEGCRLRDASILFNFTSIISLPLAVVVNLNFQLIRSIDNGAPVPIGPQFTFARTVTTLETDSFGFQVLDSQVDADTVTYSIVLANSTTISAAGVTILNATLSALETGKEHGRR